MFDFFGNVFDFLITDSFATFALESEAGATYANIDIRLAFETIAEAIATIGAWPLSFLFSNLFSLLTNVVCDVMDLFGNGLLGLLSINIGQSNSVFDIFASGYQSFIPIMQYFGIGLLILFTFAGLVRSMVTPDGGCERPVGVICRAVIAGILVYAIVPLIHTGERLFNAVYMMVLGRPGDLQFRFVNFAAGAQDALKQGERLTASDMLQSIILCAFVFFMVIIIAVKYFRFLKEIAERYVALGALIIFSPLAMPFLVQKSTRDTFGRFIRVIISQMLLLVIHMVFLRVYFAAVNSFESTMASLGSSQTFWEHSPSLFVVIWAFAIVAWLEVATRIDAYLGTLGFSAIEAGVGTMASFFQDALAMAIMFQSDCSELFTRNPERKHAQSDRPQTSAPPSLRYRSDGSVNVDSVNDIVTSSSKGARAQSQMIRRIFGSSQPDTDGIQASGADVGRAVLSASKNMPKRVREAVNVSTCSVAQGCISFEIKGTNGNGPSSMVLLHQSLSQQIAPGHGRAITVGGEGYQGFVSGPMAHTFYSSNAFASEMKKMYGEGCNVTEVGSGAQSNGLTNHTGVFNVVHQSLNGCIIDQYAPTTEYHPGPELDAHIEHIGGLDYWRYSVHQTDSETEDLYGRVEQSIPSCENASPINGVTPADAIFRSQFDNIGNLSDNLSDISVRASDPSSGIFCFSINDSLYAAAPIYDYSITPEHQSSFSAVIEAANGAQYAVVAMGDQDNPQKEESGILNDANAIFLSRERIVPDETSAVIYAQKLDKEREFELVQAALEQMNNKMSATSRDGAKPLYREAMRRKGAKNR